LAEPFHSGAQLAPPAARQGPGAMPAGAIEALSPAITRLVARTMPGGSRARGVGLGTELAQLRPYETGDDVRYIDAAATARTGTMHVRLNVPERALTTWIVLDVSPSMAFGTAGRLKADVVEGAALVFGRLGVRRAGSVGAVVFGFAPPGRGAGRSSSSPPREVGPGHRQHDEPPMRVLPPRGAKPGMAALARQLEAGVARDGINRPDALAAALSRTLRLANQPGLVVILSDFREQTQWERPLGALAMRHSVIAVEISDPRERVLPDVGRLSLVDPETGVLVSVDTRSRRLRERFESIEAARREAVARELRRLAVRHVALSTDSDWLRQLGRGIR
jgi:uncharacterized protein (DUF58 family)